MPTKPRQSKGRIRLRRPAGQGSPALWEARVSFVDPAAPGGRRWVSLYGAKRAEVEAKLAEAMAKLSRGVAPPRGAESVASYLTRWIDECAVDLKPSTEERYRDLVNRHLIPHLGGHKLATLAPSHVNTMTAGMVSAGLSGRSANHARAVLRTALNDAVRHGLVARNAAALADPRRVRDQSLEPMRPEDARAVLSAFQSHPFEPVVVLALWTGLRLGELLALTWDRVDLDAGELRVTQSMARVAGTTRIWATKTRGSTRAVPIAEPARAALSAHRERQRKQRRTAHGAWDDSWGDLVFRSTTGDPLVGTTVSRAFHEHLKDKGLPLRRFHDLRHGAATLWLAAGVDLKTVSALLGHSTITLTANTYTAVLDSLKSDAAERMTRLVAGTARAGRD